MRNSLFWSSCPVVALVAGLSMAQADHAIAARKPNILIMLCDDLGYADVGFHDSTDMRTPHLDALAASGVRFSNGYVSAPVCGPVRAGLMTGRYQQRFGFEFNPTGTEGEIKAGLPLTETTIADRFNAGGYATGLVGKWHIGHAMHLRPLNRGFDEFYGFLVTPGTYLPQNDPQVFRNTERIEETEYITDALARESIAFIDRHKERPFFLYLAFNAPHAPLEAPEEILQQFNHIDDPQRRAYAAVVFAMDQAIGRVIQKLRTENLEDDTLIVFLNDNGGAAIGSGANSSSNLPLRGVKYQLYEGGIRVPFIMSWKRQLPQDKVFDRPVIQLDILPTALAAASIPIESQTKIDGVNLLPYLTGAITGDPHDCLFWRFGKAWAVRQGNWKLIRAEPGKARLYNLRDDIGETNDLSEQHRRVVRQLRKRWRDWDSQMIDPLWEGRQLKFGSREFNK